VSSAGDWLTHSARSGRLAPGRVGLATGVAVSESAGGVTSGVGVAVAVGGGVMVGVAVAWLRLFGSDPPERLRNLSVDLGRIGSGSA